VTLFFTKARRDMKIPKPLLYKLGFECFVPFVAS